MHSPSDFLLAAKRCEVSGLEHLRQTVGVVGGIADLVHALQRERGASNLFLASSGAQFVVEREQFAGVSSAMAMQVRATLGGLGGVGSQAFGSMRLFNRVAMALLRLDGLPLLRERVVALQAQPDEVIQTFSEAIASLLAVVFEAVDTAGDPAISRLLVALFHLMQGKELAGQERATGVAAILTGAVSADARGRLQHLVDAQAHCFEVFTEFCDPRSLRAWLDLVASPVTQEVERLRRDLIAGALAGAAPLEVLRWFEQASLRMDAMRAVEQDLARALRDLCAERIQAAQADLRNQTSLLEKLEADGAELPAAIAVVMEGHSEGGLATTGTLLEGGGLGPQLGALVIDLLQAQTRRIQDMTDELARARATLNERSVVERAKDLLMSRQGLSEAQAHRLLRQTAMNQNRRLVEVAEATLAIADLLPAAPPAN